MEPRAKVLIKCQRCGGYYACLEGSVAYTEGVCTPCVFEKAGYPRETSPGGKP